MQMVERQSNNLLKSCQGSLAKSEHSAQKQEPVHTPVKAWSH